FINSHMGTHIDFPAHCIQNGNFGEKYSLDFFYSRKIFVVNIDLSKKKIPKLTYEYFYKNVKIPKQIEILLVNTNFYTLRNDERYIWNSPIVSSKIPLYFKKNFPNIKIIGFDIISLTSQLDREEGKRCHFNFLSKKYGREILVIEDMNFSNLRKNDIIKEILISPLKFEYMDGSPCSIMAKIERSNKK
ncbi:cyclase, partial [Campylobacter jejuni]|nr:cyclase [Campylobacter jejuni]ECB9854404.1 cyclase [Campylobacter jejuni]